MLPLCSPCNRAYRALYTCSCCFQHSLLYSYTRILVCTGACFHLGGSKNVGCLVFPYKFAMMGLFNITILLQVYQYSVCSPWSDSEQSTETYRKVLISFREVELQAPVLPAGTLESAAMPTCWCRQTSRSIAVLLLTTVVILLILLLAMDMTLLSTKSHGMNVRKNIIRST